ncbi:hypothetical protein ACJJTC_001964 [Scirpophaga incertulas]
MDESRNSPAAASVGSKRKLSTSGSSSDYARDGDHSKVSDSDSPVRQAPSKKARSSRHADGSRRRGGAGHADHVGGEFRERRRSVSLEADMDQRFAVLSQQLITCGKRAEVIESRRRNILKNIKVKYIRDDIGKIPPSCDYMFNPSALANYLQKIGGIDKVDKQTAPVQHTARTFSPHNKPFQQPRTANKTRRNERKESNRINNDEASSKRKGKAKNKNIRKPYKNNKP